MSHRPVALFLLSLLLLLGCGKPHPVNQLDSKLSNYSLTSGVLSVASEALEAHAPPPLRPEFEALAPIENSYDQKFLYQSLQRNYWNNSPFGQLYGSTWYYTRNSAGKVTQSSAIFASSGNSEHSILNQTYAWNSNGKLTDFKVLTLFPESDHFTYDASGRVTRIERVTQYWNSGTHYNYDNTDYLYQNEGKYLIVKKSDATTVYETSEYDLEKHLRIVKQKRNGQDYVRVEQYAFMAFVAPTATASFISPPIDAPNSYDAQTGVVAYGQYGPIREYGPNGFYRETRGGYCNAKDTHTVSCRQYDPTISPTDHRETFKISLEKSGGRQWYRRVHTYDATVRRDPDGKVVVYQNRTSTLNAKLRTINIQERGKTIWTADYASGGVYPTKVKRFVNSTLSEEQNLSYY